MEIAPIPKGTVVAVVGPTASGKTAFGVALAKALGGEILSGDSMQIYRGMDIGTAKVTAKEAQGVPHHFIDIREPGQDFSAAEYQSLARREIKRLLTAGKTPVLVGGTGLYLNAALYNYNFLPKEADSDAHKSREIRAELEQTAKERGSFFLWQELAATDPEAATKIHHNDKKRLIRALEYRRLTGRRISENNAALTSPRLMYPARIFGLNMERKLLYEAIDQRVEEMLEQGLEEEARSLWQKGLAPDSQAAQAIGYKQMFDYFRGEVEYEEAVGRIKQESRRYAKRQLTWFGRNPDILWLDSLRLKEPGVLPSLLDRLAGKQERRF